jgi:hypothetical protein
MLADGHSSVIFIPDDFFAVRCYHLLKCNRQMRTAMLCGTIPRRGKMLISPDLPTCKNKATNNRPSAAIVRHGLNIHLKHPRGENSLSWAEFWSRKLAQAAKIRQRNNDFGICGGQKATKMDVDGHDYAGFMIIVVFYTRGGLGHTPVVRRL